MPHQPTYSEITHGFTNNTFTISDSSMGSPYNALSVPTRYVAAESRNFVFTGVTLLQGHAQACGILLPYDPDEAEFYFYSFAVYSTGGLNFIPFLSVVDPSIAPVNAVLPIQTVLPSHGRIASNVSHASGCGVLQPASEIPGILAAASSVIFGVIAFNNTGSNSTNSIRVSLDTRRFDEPRYVTEAR